MEYFKQFDKPVLYNPENLDIQQAPWRDCYPDIERKVENMILNFGPQHPAAHGVLRLVLELEGEVNIIFIV